MEGRSHPRISLRRRLSLWDGESVWIRVLTSGQGLERSQISDWVTSLSAGQPWPAEMEGAAGGSEERSERGALL